MVSVRMVYILMFFVSINIMIILSTSRGSMFIMFTVGQSWIKKCASIHIQYNLRCSPKCNIIKYWCDLTSHFFIPDSPTVSIMNMHPLDVVKNATLKLVCQVLDANPTGNSFSWYKGNSTTPIGLLSNWILRKQINHVLC
jgi:hypothetical protein